MAPSYDVSTHVHCHFDYPGIDDSMPSFLTVFLSFVILVLTIVIEVIGCTPSCLWNLTRNSKSRVTTATASEEEPQNHPTPLVRASRFVVSTFWMIPLCVAFGFRMDGLKMPHYPQKCINNVDVAYPNWVVITIINILPFSIACTTWLRALVDCVLVRWNTSLPYSLWPRVLPIFGPINVIIKAGKFTREVVLRAMGASSQKLEDIEMHSGEEGAALVGAMEGNEDDEDELPPAYDEMGTSSSRSEFEVKNSNIV